MILALAYMLYIRFEDGELVFSSLLFSFSYFSVFI